MSDILLTRIAIALEKIAGNAPMPGEQTDAPAPAAAPRGRPPGSTNKPKPAAAEPAPSTEPEADPVPDVSLAQAAVTAAIKANCRDDVLKLLTSYGAKNASGVKPEDRAAFIEKATALVDAMAAAG